MLEQHAGGCYMLKQTLSGLYGYDDVVFTHILYNNIRSSPVLYLHSIRKLP